MIPGDDFWTPSRHPCSYSFVVFNHNYQERNSLEGNSKFRLRNPPSLMEVSVQIHTTGILFSGLSHPKMGAWGCALVVLT